MTGLLDLDQRTAALRRAAVRATLAPSVHNTQPWRFELSPNRLDLYSDPTRQLRELDPTGRQLLLSCGCALFNARVALATSGLDVTVDRSPEDAPANLVARITTGSPRVEHDPIASLDSAIEQRQTNRRRFNDDAIPAELLATLRAAAESEGARIHVVESDDERLMVSLLSQRADDLQNVNPAYRAEIRAWTTNDAKRLDGVPAMAVPHVDGNAHDDIPIRDFDSQGLGWLPAETHSSSGQCLLLLGTTLDSRDSWLHAGEALERVLLEITRHGFAASPLTQIVEVPTTRAALRLELKLAMHPQILLRVGHAPLTPAPRRRRLVDVLDERH